MRYRNYAAAALLSVAQASIAEEAVLNVYNWSDYIGEETLEQFEAETGIEVNYDTFNTLEVLETKLLTGGSGYDVVFPSATVLERSISAGAVRTVDKGRLSGFGNLDADILELLAKHDPRNAYGVPYTWGTVGIGYNAEAIFERMPDAPVNSLDMLFKPEIAGRFADCGIAVLDSPQEVIAIALNYLGHSPYSDEPKALKQAGDLLARLRPHLRYVHSLKSINDLAQGEICLSLSYSGDVSIAALRAAEAGKTFELRYSIPKEGTIIWFDVMAIPTDAPHPDNAHKFIDFMLRPEVIAEVSNFVFYANANAASLPHLLPDVKENPGIYPPAKVKIRLFADKSLPPKQLRERTRLWAKFRYGN